MSALGIRSIGMSKQTQRSITAFIGLAAVIAVLTVSTVYLQGSAQSPSAKKERPKKLREIAMERDVEVEGVDGSHHLTYVTMESIKQDASAIVYGRIINSRSFFDPSGAPIEQGENITTEYTVEVLRVLRDRTWETMPNPGRPAPEPLTTPLTIARNGGVVLVNGHRASVKVKGYEALSPGKYYVFFLFWSSNYKAYVLAHGIFSVVMVNEDSSLEPLASSKEMQAELRGVKLEDLLAQIK
jgi:hypothetical protein